MHKTYIMLIISCLSLSLYGCTTLSLGGRRGEDMRFQADIERLKVDVERLKERVEMFSSAQQDIYVQMEGIRDLLDQKDQAVNTEISGIAQKVREMDLAREQLRKDIIQQLSGKMVEIMKAQAAPSGQAGIEHTVKPGETLSAIATAYRVTVSRIVKANPGLKTEDSIIRVGQKLFIPE